MTQTLRNNLRRLIVIFIFTYVTIRMQSIIKHFNPFFDTIRQFVTYRNFSYVDKMRIKYPRYYDYVEWIKTVTPDNAKIYQTDLEIPYGEPLWPSNNIQMNSAMLYPRHIVAWTGLNSVIKEENRSTYIMVIDSFPRSDVKAHNVILFDQGDKNIVGNYILENYPATKLGLIEL